MQNSRKNALRKGRPALVVTTIQEPTRGMRVCADGARSSDWNLIVIGDRKGPDRFDLEGASFFSLAEQLEFDFSLSKLLPVGHYARKNLGYLLAIRAEAPYLIETDDDNIPRSEFFGHRAIEVNGDCVSETVWENIYVHFTAKKIWPRGLPLDFFQAKPSRLQPATLRCPVQQGLADGDPDVDAIYRLVLGDLVEFDRRDPVLLGEKTWCPFNSQNTTWFPEVFPLLYLPSYCSFRMTDIWRSFVAQRWLLANGYSVSFHSASVFQERNVHALSRDFADEVPGYLGNAKIRELLDTVDANGNILGYLRSAYRLLTEKGFVGVAEIPLVEAWISDIEALK